MPKPSIHHVLRKAGIVSDEMHKLSAFIRLLKPISGDVADIMESHQKLDIIAQRYKLCREFQSLLLNFWKKHYDRSIWAEINARLDLPKEERPVADARYTQLTRADVNVSHEVNRGLDHIQQFLKKPEKGEDGIGWALMSASSVPTTLYDAYNLYTGKLYIDIRQYFPDVDFSGAEEPPKV